MCQGSHFRREMRRGGRQTVGWPKFPSPSDHALLPPPPLKCGWDLRVPPVMGQGKSDGMSLLRFQHVTCDFILLSLDTLSTHSLRQSDDLCGHAGEAIVVGTAGGLRGLRVVSSSQSARSPDPQSCCCVKVSPPAIQGGWKWIAHCLILQR